MNCGCCSPRTLPLLSRHGGNMSGDMKNTYGIHHIALHRVDIDGGPVAEIEMAVLGDTPFAPCGPPDRGTANLICGL